MAKPAVPARVDIPDRPAHIDVLRNELHWPGTAPVKLAPMQTWLLAQIVLQETQSIRGTPRGPDIAQLAETFCWGTRSVSPGVVSRHLTPLRAKLVRIGALVHQAHAYDGITIDWPLVAAVEANPLMQHQPPPANDTANQEWIGWSDWTGDLNGDKRFDEAFVRPRLLPVLGSTEPDLERVLAGDVPRLLVLGSVGTGKTTFSRWLSRELGASRVVLRDLLSEHGTPSLDFLVGILSKADRVVLDGLDECAWPLAALRDVLARHPPTVLVVTSRPFVGVVEALQVPPGSWVQTRLGQLSDDAIVRMARSAHTAPGVADRTASFLRERRPKDEWGDFAATPLAVLLVGMALRNSQDVDPSPLALFAQVASRQAKRAGLSRLDDLARLALAAVTSLHMDGTEADWLTLAHGVAGLPPERAIELVRRLVSSPAFLRSWPGGGEQLGAWPTPVWQYLAACALQRDAEQDKAMDLSGCVKHPLALGAVEHASRLLGDGPRADAINLFAQALASAASDPSLPPTSVKLLVELCAEPGVVSRLTKATIAAVLHALTLRYRVIMDLKVSDKLRPLLFICRDKYQIQAEESSSAFRFLFLDASRAYAEGAEASWRELTRTARRLTSIDSPDAAEVAANELQHALTYERDDDPAAAIALYATLRHLPDHLLALREQFEGVAWWRGFAFPEANGGVVKSSATHDEADGKAGKEAVEFAQKDRIK